MFENESIQQLKAIAKITDFITAKQKGNNYVALCPFHNERTPSFTIPKTNNTYKCFGCGKSGDVFSLLKETAYVYMTVFNLCHITFVENQYLLFTFWKLTIVQGSFSVCKSCKLTF